MRVFTDREKEALTALKKSIDELVLHKVNQAKAKGETPDPIQVESESEKELFGELEKNWKNATTNNMLFYQQLKEDDPASFDEITEHTVGLKQQLNDCRTLDDLLVLSEVRPLSEKQVLTLYHLGLGWFDDEDYATALLYFNFLTQADPQNPEVWFVRGMAEQNLLKIKEAMASYSMTISLAPHHLLPYLHVMDTLILGEELEKARECYEVFMREVDPHAYTDNAIVKEKLKTIHEYLKNPNG